MIVVRNCFTAKPGCAGKLAKQLKEGAAVMNMGKFRVMTDLTGDFNTVVLEIESENVTEFEARLKEYGSSPAVREKMAGYTDLWITGRRDIFEVVS